MKKFYRNPLAWAFLAAFAALTYLNFKKFPVAAPITYGILIVCLGSRMTYVTLRFRRLGYRLRPSGPEGFIYMEMADGEIRRLLIDRAFLSKGKIDIYWPSSDAWRQKMPDWAKERRDEILDRIRSELGNRFGQCVETGSAKLEHL